MKKEKEIIKVYNQIAEDYARDFSSISEYIDEFLAEIPKNSRILDLGCGVGTDSNYMNKMGYDVTGIDLSPGMLKIARERYPGLNFIQLNFNEIDSQPDSFDGIISSFSLIHFKKKEIPEVLDKIYLLLKKLGIFYLSLQEGESNEAYISEPLMNNKKVFLSIFSYDEIKNLLEKKGFTIFKKYEREPKPNELQFRKLYMVLKKKDLINN